MTLPLTAGPISIGSFQLSLYWMLIGTTVTLVGLQAFLLGCIAQVLFDYSGRARERWLTVFSYDRSLDSRRNLNLYGHWMRHSSSRTTYPTTTASVSAHRCRTV